MAQWRAVIDIPATDEGPSAARGIIGALLPVWDRHALVFDAQLVASELVTNAFQHAPGTDSFELEIIRTTTGVLLALADGSAVRPVIAKLNNDSPTGRGMTLVQALSTRWGAESYRGGKRVWVVLGEDSE
jgi:hypothetical protein